MLGQSGNFFNGGVHSLGMYDGDPQNFDYCYFYRCFILALNSNSCSFKYSVFEGFILSLIPEQKRVFGPQVLFSGTNFSRCNFVNINFDQVDFKDKPNGPPPNFSGATFTNCNFKTVKNIEYANFKDATFIDCSILLSQYSELRKGFFDVESKEEIREGVDLTECLVYRDETASDPMPGYGKIPAPCTTAVFSAAGGGFHPDPDAECESV